MRSPTFLFYFTTSQQIYAMYKSQYWFPYSKIVISSISLFSCPCLLFLVQHYQGFHLFLFLTFLIAIFCSSLLNPLPLPPPLVKVYHVEILYDSYVFGFKFSYVLDLSFIRNGTKNRVPTVHPIFQRQGAIFYVIYKNFAFHFPVRKIELKSQNKKNSVYVV